MNVGVGPDAQLDMELQRALTLDYDFIKDIRDDDAPGTAPHR